MGQFLSMVRNYFFPGSETTSTLHSVTGSSMDIDSTNRRRLSSKGDMPLKNYSWNNRPKVNPDDYQFIGQESQTLVKQPGTLRGHQFIIERCRNCNIFLFDWSDTVTILDCTGCAFFVGPVKGSIFLRHCVDCTVLVLSQQFRTRDCRRISAYLYCCTQPIIENTVGAKFACLQISYTGLEEQMKAAGLSPFSNNWSQVHDFTPSSGDIMSSHNFSVVQDPLATAKVGLNDPDTIGDIDMRANFDPSDSVVPYTTGVLPNGIDGEHCLVMFFAEENNNIRLSTFTREMRNSYPSIFLINSKDLSLSTADIQRILKTTSYTDAVKRGAVIILYYFGPNASTACQKITASLGSMSKSIFVSGAGDCVPAQIESLWNLADMKMN